MSHGILIGDLKAVCARINQLTDSPPDTYTIKPGGKYVANVGNYHLDGAYGGWALHRLVNESGGIADVFRSGHVSKRELYNRMHAFIDGIMAVEK